MSATDDAAPKNNFEPKLSAKPKAAIISVLNNKLAENHGVTLTLKKLEWKEIKAPAALPSTAAAPAKSAPTALDKEKPSEAASALETKEVKSAVASAKSSKAADPGAVALASSEWTIAWVDLCEPKVWAGLKPHQKINQFPGIEQLSRKKNLGANLNAFVRNQSATIRQQYSFVPKTWVLPSEYFVLMEDLKSVAAAAAGTGTTAGDSKEEAGSAASSAGDAKASSASSGSSSGGSSTGGAGEQKRGRAMTLIVKPDAKQHGSGIFLTQTASDISPSENVVVQQYIDNPFLIAGRKFDMRLYVLVTSVSPLYVYLFDDGLARFCSELYVAPTGDNMKSAFMHLTNYAVNKGNSKLEFSPTEGQSGNKWTLVAMKEHMAKRGLDVNAMWTRVGDCVVRTIQSVLPKLVHEYKVAFPKDEHGGSCFQLLGFDVLLDDDLQPWLCEVNRDPSLKCDSDLDLKLKTSMLADLLRIVDPRPYTKSAEQLAKERQELRKMTSKEQKAWKAEASSKALKQRLEHEARLTSEGRTRFRRVFPPVEADGKQDGKAAPASASATASAATESKEAKS